MENHRQDYAPEPPDEGFDDREHGRGRHGRRRGPRCGGGRITAYFLMAVVLNLLLAVYAMYVVGVSMDMTGTAALAGTAPTVSETVFRMLLLASPILLTVLLNRILYRLFRGRRVFPRGMGVLAVLVILLVQVLTVCLVLRYGSADGTGGFSPLVTQIESLAEEAP